MTSAWKGAITHRSLGWSQLREPWSSSTMLMRITTPAPARKESKAPNLKSGFSPPELDGWAASYIDEIRIGWIGTNNDQEPTAQPADWISCSTGFFTNCNDPPWQLTRPMPDASANKDPGRNSMALYGTMAYHPGRNAMCFRDVLVRLKLKTSWRHWNYMSACIISSTVGEELIRLLEKVLNIAMESSSKKLTNSNSYIGKTTRRTDRNHNSCLVYHLQ